MASLNTSCFAPEWKCFIFLETSKRLPHSICSLSTHVTLSASVLSLSIDIWGKYPLKLYSLKALSVDASSVDALSVDALSVEALSVDASSVDAFSVEALGSSVEALILIR